VGLVAVQNDEMPAVLRLASELYAQDQAAIEWAQECDAAGGAKHLLPEMAQLMYQGGGDLEGGSLREELGVPADLVGRGSPFCQRSGAKKPRMRRPRRPKFKSPGGRFPSKSRSLKY
jgi:hypothetical protein